MQKFRKRYICANMISFIKQNSEKIYKCLPQSIYFFKTISKPEFKKLTFEWGGIKKRERKKNSLEQQINMMSSRVEAEILTIKRGRSHIQEFRVSLYIRDALKSVTDWDLVAQTVEVLFFIILETRSLRSKSQQNCGFFWDLSSLLTETIFSLCLYMFCLCVCLCSNLLIKTIILD